MVRAGIHISISNASVGYTRRHQKMEVLKALNLDFPAGQLTAIVGPNGGGKSTLLKSLAGLQPLIEGQIWIQGEPIEKINRQELAKKIAVVLTEKIGGFNLRVREVVASGQMPYTGLFHRLHADQEQVIAAAAERAGVTAFMDLPMYELSDGMFQKTMIAKALAQATPVLLLDEPTAYLDYASRHQLFLLLKELAERDGKSVVISSHDLDLVMKYCHQVVAIDEGKAVMLSPQQALTAPAFQKMTGGFL